MVGTIQTLAYGKNRSLTVWGIAFILLTFSHFAFAEAGKMSLGGSFLLGIPHPINFSLDGKLGEVLSLSLAGGTIKIPLNTSAGAKTEVRLTNFDFRARWHPWSGSLFFGGMFGYQALSGSGQATIATQGISVPLTVKAQIKGYYTTPHFGWMWIFGSGFMVGLELGAQIPFGVNTTLETSSDDQTKDAFLEQAKNTTDYKTFEGDISDKGNQLGKKVLPYFTLLRLGWMF